MSRQQNFFDAVLSETRAEVLTTETLGDAKREYRDLSPDELTPGRFQRRRFDSSNQQIEEMAESIKAAGGIIQPIVVRRGGEGGFEILAGERRWRGSLLLKLATVPCVILDVDDHVAALVCGIENLQRRDLNPIEEAETYQMMMKESKLNQKLLADKLGFSKSHISRIINLTKLDSAIQTMLIEGRLEKGHGAVLVDLDPADQKKLAERERNKLFP